MSLFVIARELSLIHDDVIKRKHFPRYWPFVWGIHRSPVNSPHRGKWRGALMSHLDCAWTNSWANKGDAGDLGRHCAQCDVTVMCRGTWVVVYMCSAANDICRPMMTSSNGHIFRNTGHLCGEFTGPRWIPHTKQVTRSFDVFFDLRPKKRLSKQW